MTDEITSVSSLGLQPPKGYNIDDEEQWKKYKQIFGLFLKATDLEDKSDNKKIAIFLTCAGDDILEIYNGMGKINTWQELLVKFDEHFKEKTNTVVNSYRFYNLRQEQDEPVDRFVNRLKRAAKNCDFKEEDRMIRDMLVIGLKEPTVKERLLREKELTLVKAMELCRVAEYSRKNMQEMEHKQEVHQVKEERKKIHNNFSYSCSKCGKKHEIRKCPAYGKRCSNCNVYNHYVVMCKNRKPTQQRKKNKVDAINQCVDSDSSSEEFVVDSISTDCGHSELTKRNCMVNIKPKVMEEILPSVEPVDIKNTLNAEVTKYLWDAFGSILPDALFDVCQQKPRNPIHSLAHYLLKHKYNQTPSQLLKKKKESDAYRADILKARKEKKIADTLEWKSKLTKRRKPEESDDSYNKAIHDVYVTTNELITSLNFYN